MKKVIILAWPTLLVQPLHARPEVQLVDQLVQLGVAERAALARVRGQRGLHHVRAERAALEAGRRRRLPTLRRLRTALPQRGSTRAKATLA
jgi:hypothetical protein